MANMTNSISPIITRADAKDKLIDFRDNLSKSGIGEYAMMHSIGGAKRSFKSTIKCSICDYSAGKGEGNSTTVYANFDIDSIYYLYNYIKLLMGPSTATSQSDSMIDTSKLNDAINRLIKVYNNLKVQNVVDSAMTDEIVNIGQTLRKFEAQVKSHSSAINPGEPDFSYSQERVDVYKVDTKTGIAPVTVVSVTRTGTRKNGEKSRMPWCFKISNGSAPTKRMPNGTTSYEGAKFKVEKACFINVSDKDMFRMMTRIVRYIEVWEDTVCIPIINQALIQKEQERQTAANNRT